MHLVTATVVRLVRTLAHGFSVCSPGFPGPCSAWCPLGAAGVGPDLWVGWHRPPTALARPAPRHAASFPWTCGTGRRRATCQRYASPRGTVKPRPPQPVDEALPIAPRPCYLRADRGSPHQGWSPSTGARRTGHPHLEKRALTCENGVVTGLSGASRHNPPRTVRPVAQPVEKVVERPAGVAGRHDRTGIRGSVAATSSTDERVEPVENDPAELDRPGTASSRTFSPTSRCGSRRAAR